MSQPVRGWKWCIIADYTYVCMVEHFSLCSYCFFCHKMKFLFPCASSCPGAHWEMLAPLRMSVGEFLEERPCPKLVIGISRPLPLGNLLVLVAVGAQKNIVARQQSPFTERVPDLPWDVLDAQLSFSLTAPLAVLCFQLGEGVTAACPSPCSRISPREGRREVWCRCRSLCRSQPQGIPPVPCVPPRSFC